jgi:hypothetical protein
MVLRNGHRAAYQEFAEQVEIRSSRKVFALLPSILQARADLAIRFSRRFKRRSSPLVLAVGARAFRSLLEAPPSRDSKLDAQAIFASRPQRKLGTRRRRLRLPHPMSPMQRDQALASSRPAPVGRCERLQGLLWPLQSKAAPSNRWRRSWLKDPPPAAGRSYRGVEAGPWRVIYGFLSSRDRSSTFGRWAPCPGVPWPGRHESTLIKRRAIAVAKTVVVDGNRFRPSFRRSSKKN